MATLQWGLDQLIEEIRSAKAQSEDTQMLQWGLDQLIEEIPAEFFLPLIKPMLQWGLDQLIEEIIQLMSMTMVPGGASMGPRSADRGN